MPVAAAVLGTGTTGTGTTGTSTTGTGTGTSTSTTDRPRCVFVPGVGARRPQARAAR